MSLVFLNINLLANADSMSSKLSVGDKVWKQKKTLKKIPRVFLKLRRHRNRAIDINAISSQRLLSFLKSQDPLDETEREQELFYSGWYILYVYIKNIHTQAFILVRRKKYVGVSENISCLLRQQDCDILEDK